MSAYENRQGSFFHISRGAQPVLVNSREFMLFWSDILPFESTYGMQLSRSDGAQGPGFIQYASSPQEAIDFSERVLVWSRMVGGKTVGGMRWVPYITDSSIDTQTVKPLREVFAPRIDYDRNNNTLMLTFWTNINSDYNSTVYDEAQLYPVVSESFSDAIATAEPLRAKRVLCTAVGSLWHGFVQGGFLMGTQADYVVDATNMENVRWDLVPVFQRPTIVNWEQTLDNLGGVVVDGWYGPTGLTGVTGVTGVFSLDTFSEYSEITGIFTIYYREFEYANGILINVGDTGSTSVFNTITCEGA